ncbi:hypothetical protein EC1094_1921 [Escherichia coli]|nr:hypothetical protein BN130_3419 [Cronobacter malonaticus 507]CTP95603.1 hypothetical protein EC1094_1921 [Escherichia coli]SMZ47066.1 hypothetical protein EC1094V2_3971 [Escherichia coli]
MRLPCWITATEPGACVLWCIDLLTLPREAIMQEVYVG